jgi:dephospho-CoA kinase
MPGATTIVGLTGGIGSGKSTVTAGLRDRGAAVADADRVAREVVEPGQPAHAELVRRFGDGVLRPDGSLDRAALASVVFADDDARADLNAITHPRIGARMVQLVADAVEAEAPVVVLDIPLLAPATVSAYGLEAVIVVDTPEDTAVARLVEQRGFTEADARARVASQMGREERRRLVELVPRGWVVDNGGDRAALEPELDRIWAALTAGR